MATKWAIANGNWADGTTWNDGIVPATGDIVYANGYNVNIGGNNVYIGTGEIRNDECPDTGNSGGIFRLFSAAGQLRTLEANIIGTNIFVANTSNSTITINGNIECAGLFNNSTIVNMNVNVTGNFISHPATRVFNNIYTQNVVITGDVLLESAASFSNNNTPYILVNGSFETYFSITFVTFILNGNLVTHNSCITVTNFIIDGSIEYESTNNTIGVIPQNLTISNPATFFWKDITTPRVNPFIILTDAEMNNHQQYPPEDEVKQGTEYAWGEKFGTYTTDYPQEAEVLQGVTYDNGNKTGTLEPVVLGDYPDVDKVLVGTSFDYGNKVGTFQPVADYPAEADVLQGVEYAYGQMNGTFTTDYPQEANVLQGVEYANGSMVGTLEAVQLQADYPSEDDVRFDVPFDFGNKQGKCHVPIPEDVREGVLVDVNDVGTLIPSSGGDRLRIADFGYYTRSTSITYIVDLTESDKPAFADCEEIVLRSLFPKLDLNNIPDKYFDDLFIQFLRYRLLVEYYRGTSVNSKFTPSEPTTEIVNYANTKCEYWLNTANLFLQLWGEKYPNSVRKDRILL